MKWINEGFSQKLQKKISAFEAQTSIEFVPVVTHSSSSYLWPRAFLAVANGSLFHFFWSHHFHLEASWRNLALLAGFWIGFGLLLAWAPVARWLLPETLFSHEVEKKAVQAFALEEVFQTQARTGVLVFVSLFERRVFVLADKGLDARIPASFWKDLGLELARDFAAQRPGDSFFDALEKMLSQVAPHFPPTADNPNELSDDLRRR